MTRRKGKPKQNKNSDKSEKSGVKRKTISPIETKDCTQGNNNRSGQYTDSELHNSSKRFHSNSPPYFFTFDNNSLPPDRNIDMSYQQPTYGAQFVPSPPGFVPQISNVQQTATNTIPPWANMLLDEMKLLKSGLSKIDDIEKTVNTINNRFIDLETKVANIEQRVCEVEKSCTYISKEFDANLKDIKDTKTEVIKLKTNCENFETKIDKMKTEMQHMTDRLTDSESRSMRNNLIFYGIPEGPDENCENSVKKFISEILGIVTDEMTFDRAHRLGNDRTAKKPRPIVVRFAFYKERENVRSKAYNVNDALRTEGYGVSIQRPKNVREARKNLYHIMKQAQNRGQHAKFYGDKLYINGELYVPDE